MKITLLDGPIGTRLIDQGHPCPAPAWSAQALIDNPSAIEEIHREYAKAGATVHTTNTFRTRQGSVGDAWGELTQRAVSLTKSACPAPHKTAGSIAPIADCYRPDLSPDDPGVEHKRMAEALAMCGVDILLCETFPHVGEALAAVQAAVETGVETWVSFTAGPRGDLLQPHQVRRGAQQAIDLGAQAVLVNCIPASDTLRFVQALQGLGVPFGAYANAGHPDEGIGWAQDPRGPHRYADFARTWVDQGATLIGTCCGTGPEHIRVLSERLNSED